MHPCPLNFTNVISSNYIESLGECLEFLIYLSNIEFKIEIYTFISQKPVAFYSEAVSEVRTNSYHNKI